MNPRKLKSVLILFSVLAINVAATFVAIGCTDEEPTPTPVPPTSTPIPPTPTPLPPTATPVPPTATPVPHTATPAPDYSAYLDVPGIVDPTNFDWPREVESSEGLIVLDQPPALAHFASQGHAEIAFGLIDKSRVAAIYSFFADPDISNISDHVEGIPEIGFEPEEVVSLEPEVIVVSKFVNPDLVAVFKESGIPVLRTALEGRNGDIPNILLMAYMLGAEDRGLELAAEVASRLDFVRQRIVSAAALEDERPSVLTVSDFGQIWAAGADTNVDSIIKDAGGINTAAEVESFQQISIESIAAMDPDVIIITQPMESGQVFAEMLMSSPALQGVDAVQNNEVHVVLSRHFTTLSHWNVRGVETLAKMLYPELFADVEFKDFETYDPE